MFFKTIRIPLCALYAVVIIFFSGCGDEPERRSSLDLEVGRASSGGVSFVSENGLAAVTSISPGNIEFRAQSPVVKIRAVTGTGAVTAWTVTMRNCMPSAELTSSAAITPVKTQLSPTVISWSITLPGSDTVDMLIVPPDYDTHEAFRFAVISDIQGSPNKDMYGMVSSDPAIRFVISAGDLTEDGDGRGFESFLANLGELDVPLYSTAGNHDIMNGSPRNWQKYIGRFNVNFAFKGACFTLIDSADGTVEKTVYGWLKGYIAAASQSVHVFVTHYPPFDPFGLRGGSFSSNAEASKLLAMLARGYTDITIYGHIHMFYAYSNAGMPAYIAGGGGGIQGIIDPYGRHYLVIDAAADRIENVAMIRVD